MKHCPHCHYEYEDWASTCSDCEVELVVGPPPAPAPPPTVLDPGQFRDWVILTNVPNVMMGNLLKDQLEQAGIPVLMKRTRATDIAEWSHNDFAWQDLYVPERYVRRARRLLTSAPTHGYPDAEADADWEDEADDAEAEELASGDVVGVPPANVASGWYLIDSARPEPVSSEQWAGTGTRRPVPGDAGTAPNPRPAPGALPSLSRYRRNLTRRKDHLPPPPEADRVLPFRPPGAGSAGPDLARWDREAGGGTGPTWPASRIYRALIGLLFLAWTLPFVLQLVQYFRDALIRLFP